MTQVCAAGSGVLFARLCVCVCEMYIDVKLEVFKYGLSSLCMAAFAATSFCNNLNGGKMAAIR